MIHTGSSIGKIVAVTGNFRVPKFRTRRMKMKSQKSVALHAAELHKRAIVIDCHSNILMPIADGYVRLGKQVEVPDPERWKPPFEMTERSAGDRGWPLSNRIPVLTERLVDPNSLECMVTVMGLIPYHLSSGLA
jgi:hypothetical protein